MTAPFPLGQIVATPAALELLEEAGEDPLCYLVRHRCGDWGELDEHGHRENELSLKQGWRILSFYPVGGRCIWIITESDKSVTTILSCPRSTDTLYSAAGTTSWQGNHHLRRRA